VKTLFDVLWPTWVAVGVLAELAALILATKKDDGLPLSDHFWAWFKIKDHSRKYVILRWVGRTLILGFTFWVGPHLAFAIWG
jgi:hypothetical protein